MKTVVLEVVRLLGSSLAALLSKALGVAKLFFEWRKASVALEEKKLEAKQTEKEEREEEKRQKDFEERASEVAQHGTVADLLDLKRAAPVVVAACLLAAGCATEQIHVDFQGTRAWEGRYEKPENFYRATRAVSLERGESIWVLSSRTLERVLIQASQQKSEK